MRPRRALAFLVLIACGRGAQPGAPDASPIDSDANGGGDDALPDASTELELVPPVVVGVEPSAEIWLHEPLRFVFDEPIDVSTATVTATLDGSPVPATFALDGDRVLAVTLDASVRGVGAVKVALGGMIRDKWGNVAVLPIDAERVAPAWHRPGIDRGPAAETPSIAMGEKYMLAAWTVGTPRAVVVSKYTGTWKSLAGTLGASDASSASAGVDAMDRPLVAWIENGAARVSRWENDTWNTLPSPGNGSHVILAGDRVAVIGATAQVRTLVADVWQPAGDFAISGTVLGTPAFTGTAVGWVERSGSSTTIRVFNNGTAMTPISVDDSTRVSLASRGSSLAIAYDEHGGSFNVVAALANGTSWTRLGRLLDVDAAGNARAPAVALDSTNQPIVAWSERIEANERGVVARWTGAAWATLGDSQWHAAGGAPTGPSLVLVGDAPMISAASSGAIRINRFNGPTNVTITRSSIAGCSVNPASPPATLFATGCFSAGATPHAGLVPYDIVNELWSDGTRKRRWIGLPNGTSMTQSGNDSWVAPVGTIIAKEFAIETTPGNPATRRPVETRFLVNTASGWTGFSYQWRTNGSDADLLNDGQFTKDWALDAGGSYRHLYPSRSQCLSCHHGSVGPLLGIRPQQLTRWQDYGGTIADQIPALAAMSVGPSTTVTPYISTHDRSASWEQRSRSYMAANCAHCHNPSNISIKDLRYATPLASTRLCEVIQPGSPSQSVLYARVTSRPGMPPLGTLITDPLPEQLLSRWISGMTSCP
ncbi:MAG: hypothetical protein M4D80_00790 [Myxococcota bacterium]|nr:hypothetical protein [Myxococcota bacterium]